MSDEGLGASLLRDLYFGFKEILQILENVHSFGFKNSLAYKAFAVNPVVRASLSYIIETQNMPKKMAWSKTPQYGKKLSFKPQKSV
jgi:hypothetical protein